jgi:hypothetical protein
MHVPVRGRDRHGHTLSLSVAKFLDSASLCLTRMHTFERIGF